MQLSRFGVLMLCVLLGFSVRAEEVSLAVYFSELEKKTTSIEGIEHWTLHLVVKNSGDGPIRVPTAGLTHFVSRKESIMEVSLAFNNGYMIDGFSEVIPEAQFAPVEIRSGEAAVIDYTIIVSTEPPPKGLRVDLIIREGAALRYGLWSGELSAFAVNDHRYRKSKSRPQVGHGPHGRK